jgi:hypothetical protein
MNIFSFNELNILCDNYAMKHICISLCLLSLNLYIMTCTISFRKIYIPYLKVVFLFKNLSKNNIILWITFITICSNRTSLVSSVIRIFEKAIINYCERSSFMNYFLFSFLSNLANISQKSFLNDFHLTLISLIINIS